MGWGITQSSCGPYRGSAKSLKSLSCSEAYFVSRQSEMLAAKTFDLRHRERRARPLI